MFQFSCLRQIPFSPSLFWMLVAVFYYVLLFFFHIRSFIRSSIFRSQRVDAISIYMRRFMKWGRRLNNGITKYTSGSITHYVFIFHVYWRQCVCNHVCDPIFAQIATSLVLDVWIWKCCETEAEREREKEGGEKQSTRCTEHWTFKAQMPKASYYIDCHQFIFSWAIYQKKERKTLNIKSNLSFG